MIGVAEMIGGEYALTSVGTLKGTLPFFFEPSGYASVTPDWVDTVSKTVTSPFPNEPQCILPIT